MVCCTVRFECIANTAKKRINYETYVILNITNSQSQFVLSLSFQVPLHQCHTHCSPHCEPLIRSSVQFKFSFPFFFRVACDADTFHRIIFYFDGELSKENPIHASYVEYNACHHWLFGSHLLYIVEHTVKHWKAYIDVKAIRIFERINSKKIETNGLRKKNKIFNIETNFIY